MEKLIRDNFPEIAEKNKAPISWRSVNSASEHIDVLAKKIQEELREFWNAHYFYQTWEQSHISNEQKGLYLPVFRGKVEEEAGDVLTPYDDLISISSSSRSGDIEKLQQEKRDFVNNVMGLGYNMTSIQSFQSTKNKIFGTFQKGIVGIFKK